MKTLDFIVVIAYLVGIGILGSSFYRSKSTSKEYFLGNRSISWLPVGISIMAANLSAITLMGNPSWGYEHNLELIWIGLGAILAAPLVIIIFASTYLKLNLFTAYEYLETRFNLQVRLLTSMLFQLLRCMHVAIAIYAPALTLHLVMHLPFWECVLLMGLLTTAYTSIGGMRAVIYTDAIQFGIVMSGIALVFWTAISHAGGISLAYTAARDAGRLRLFDFSLSPSRLTSFWACVIGGTVLSLAPLATDQAILQRLLATKSLKDCKRSVLLQAGLSVPIGAALYLTGTSLFAFYHRNPSHLRGLTSVDAILPFFAVHELHFGIAGFIVAAILASSMAVMSAGINSLTTATTVDFYQRIFRPNETPEHYANVGRVGTVIWGVVVTFLAIFAGVFGPLAIGYLRISSFVSGPILGIFLLGALTKRTTARGSLLGAAAGMIVIVAVALGTHWSFLYLGVIGVFATVAVGYVASFFMEPPRVQGQATGPLPAERLASNGIP